MQLAMGMHLSVICSEDFPPKRHRQRLRAILAMCLRSSMQSYCAHWPHGNPPADFTAFQTRRHRR